MRQSQKEWVWRSIAALSTGSPKEAYAVTIKSDAEIELQVIKGRSRNLLPRT